MVGSEPASPAYRDTSAVTTHWRGIAQVGVVIVTVGATVVVCGYSVGVACPAAISAAGSVASYVVGSQHPTIQGAAIAGADGAIVGGAGSGAVPGIGQGVRSVIAGFGSGAALSGADALSSGTATGSQLVNGMLGGGLAGTPWDMVFSGR